MQIHDEVPNFRIACRSALKKPHNYATDPCLWRSSHLQKISHLTVNYLSKKLHIQCHIDLRSEDEVMRQGKPEKLIASGVVWKHFPLIQENHSLRKMKLPTFHDYFNYYMELIHLNKQVIADIINSIFSTPYQRYLLSCQVGKDRTGILICLIMTILDINQHEILEDYHYSKQMLLPNIYLLKQQCWVKKKLTQAEYSSRFQCDKRTITLLFDKIRKEYKTINQFFSIIGIDKNIKNGIKAKFYNYCNKMISE